MIRALTLIAIALVGVGSGNESIAQELIEACHAFADGRVNDDDMTVILVRVK